VAQRKCSITSKTRINRVSSSSPKLCGIGYQDSRRGVTSELQVTYRSHTTLLGRLVL